MARDQRRSTRKATGRRYAKPGSSKRKYELAGYTANTKLDEKKRTRTKRTPGGNQKTKILQINKINVALKDGKSKVATMKNVLENTANPNLVRRNIITKGSVVETDLGKVKITSRPGQEGKVCGSLLK